ncbi:MAG: RrF2 family transcriptional regulator [Nitrospinota bacterium]
MKISSKGHYAVEALVCMASRDKSKPLSLAEISRIENTSLHYLEQLFLKLRKGGLVKSVRGPGGGYLLTKDPSEISIGDIFMAVDESMELTECSTSEELLTCSKSYLCKTQRLWSYLFKQFETLLYSITIEDILTGDIFDTDIVRK